MDDDISKFLEFYSEEHYSDVGVFAHAVSHCHMTTPLIINLIISMLTFGFAI